MEDTGKASFSDENQRVIIKFLYLKGVSASGIHRDLVAVLGKCALAKRTVHKWCHRFAEKNFDTEDHRGGDHTSDSVSQERIERIEEALQQSRAWSVRSLSAHCGIPRAACYEILTKTLGMKKINAKWIPHELTPGQVETRVVYSECNLLKYNQQTSRLKHTIATDETWVSLYRPPEKDQLKTWVRKGDQPTCVALPDRYGPKVMLALAMDYNGICYYEVLEHNEKMNSSRYLEFLKKLMQNRTGVGKPRVWLLDDNAKPHRSAEINTWIKENKIERWLQPPYSPDLSPCDYGCFHPLKRSLGGVAYPTVDALKEALEIKVIEGNAKGTYTAVQKLPERWARCINEAGECL